MSRQLLLTLPGMLTVRRQALWPECASDCLHPGQRQWLSMGNAVNSNRLLYHLQCKPGNQSVCHCLLSWEARVICNLPGEELIQEETYTWKNQFQHGMVGITAQPWPGSVLKRRRWRIAVLLVHNMQKAERKVSLIWLMFVWDWWRRNSGYFIPAASPYSRTLFDGKTIYCLAKTSHLCSPW